MEKDRKLKVVMLSAIIIAVIGLTVAFAALSSVLNITGTSTMDKAGWDIHFKNVQYVGKSSTATVSGTPSPSSNNTAISISGLSVTLKQPGDYVTYSADIENSGDIDAEIALVTPPSLTSAQQTLFDFDVVYTGTNTHPSQGDELPHTSPNNIKHITMTFKYKDSVTASQLPSQAQTINLTYSIQYVQKFSATTTQSQSQSSQTYEVGDKFCLNGQSECFYTISDNGSTVTALAEWNLDTDNTGIQSSEYRGYREGMTTKGDLYFSTTNYWDPNNELDYSDGNYLFVFNSNSNLWQPVQNYQTYLRDTLSKTSVTASLISYEQVFALATSYGGLENLPSWFFDTSWWSGTAASNYQLLLVDSARGFSVYSTDSNGYGVRPVITISKSEI